MEGSMSAGKIRVAWLAAYDATRLQPEIAILRQPRPELQRPATWIVNLAHALAARNDVDLHVITASSAVGRNETVRRNGVTFHVVRHAFPYTCRGFPPYLRLDLWSRYAYLRRQTTRLLKRLQPDLIHVHGTEYGYGLVALDTGLPTIVTMQGIVSRLMQGSPTTANWLQAPIERYVIRNISYFGTRTAWATEFIRSLNKTATVYDLPEAVGEVFFKTAGGSLGQKNILMVGLVHRPKGIEDALEAMRIVLAACPGARLVVVGAGIQKYLGELQRRAEVIGVNGSIDWLGFKTAAEIADLHAQSALLVHPSHLDNSPNSVAEAMASGLPVIASNVGGIPSMIEHNRTGILVAPRSHRELANAMIGLLRSKPDRERLAGAAREVALARHRPAYVAERTLHVYQDIHAKERSGGAAGPQAMEEADRQIHQSSRRNPRFDGSRSE
jgi:glycosyltransferase involved in cell wall biosynthesis